MPASCLERRDGAPPSRNDFYILGFIVVPAGKHQPIACLCLSQLNIMYCVGTQACIQGRLSTYSISSRSAYLHNITNTWLMVRHLGLLDIWIWYRTVLRIRDVYPGSRILIFTHPGSRIQNQQQKRGGEKFDVIPFYVATNFTKLFIILVLKY